MGCPLRKTEGDTQMGKKKSIGRPKLVEEDRKVPMTVSIPRELLKKIDSVADDRGTSRSALVIPILQRQPIFKR